MLPIHAAKERILAELARAGALILTAPTGSGKSTQVPQYLVDKIPGKLLVLEPRRIAARSLAARVGQESGTQVGYQVRFDSRPGDKILFQTYGVFVQRLLKDPRLSGVGAVLLDEFHERTLDADLALAWLKLLRRSRPELKLVVMSATLDAEVLERYLPGAARIDVPGRLHPVEIRRLPVDGREGPERGARRALETLAAEGLDGSVLVFLPGQREIRRAMDELGRFCREQGLLLRSLHGSMDLSEQQRVLDPGGERCVILATDVAETGLTVPGVTSVIDSGLHRRAAYDAGRDINTLFLSRISRASAAQRAGRAGRTAPGRCVRLWASSEERGMAESLPPEIRRLELSSVLLQAASLPEPIEWPTAPAENALAAARRTLLELKAVDSGGRITARGRALLRYPAPPRVAAVLEAAREAGPSTYERACAMAAVFESERRADKAADLGELADELLLGGRGELSRDAAAIYRQFSRLGGDFGSERGALPEALWLAAFPGRLAAAAGGVYRLADGRSFSLQSSAPLVLALDLQERGGGGRARQAVASLFLPCALKTVERTFPGECAWSTVVELDAAKGRAVKEERLMFRNLVLARKESAAGKDDRRAAAELWAEKFALGELRHPGLDEKVEQLVARIKTARGLYPALGFQEMGEDDWRLIYGELCAGKSAQKDIERAPLAPQVLAYLGKPLADFLEKSLPTRRRLPSGRTGRFTYFEGRPAELSARLGDFLKMTGKLTLCEGKLPVLFDILAPNYRTVQKTDDLGSFWNNTYPQVKKELQRRYPKHPWP